MAYTLKSDIAYVPDNPHPRQHLDLYIPTNHHNPPQSSPSSSSSLVPLIIYIHGGAFRYGDKVNDLVPTRLVTARHYALASINYRLSGDAVFPAAVQDCKAAVRFLRSSACASYGLDPHCFVVMGESAGGYMATMVGLTGVLSVPDFESNAYTGTSSAVNGVIDFYGPTDFAQMDQHAPPDAPFRHDAPDSPESLFLGRHITDPDARELVQKANPVEYVSDETPPVLIAHGTADRIVPFHQSVLLREALDKAGREVVWHPVEGTDHVFGGITDEQQKDLDRVVDEWLLKIFGQ